MATITSKLKKGAGWGPLASHAAGKLHAVYRASPELDWYKITLHDTEKGKLRVFALSMTKSELRQLKASIDRALEE